MCSASEYEEFRSLVDYLVLNSIDSGMLDFSDLLISLPSIYPGTVLRSIDRLASAGNIRNQISQKIKESACSWKDQGRTRLISITESLSRLPVPHPLDYEWRFGREAISHILDRGLNLTRPEDVIVLFGVPSVFWEAIREGYPRRLILFETNRSMTEFFSGQNLHGGTVIPCDLMADDLPRISANLVISDPPWYEECVKSFLWSATLVCCQGGFMLLSTPPIGTRPGISREWKETVGWAENLGFALIEVIEGILPYVSPPFERNALKAEGLRRVPKGWRRGNLAVFERKCCPEIPRPRGCLTEQGWIDETIQGIRFRLRRQDNASCFSDPCLEKIVDGDILASVSRLDARRASVDIWTSGNRIFKCRNTWAAQLIMKAIADGGSPDEKIVGTLGRPLTDDESVMVHIAENQLRSIVQSEQAEYLLDEEDV